MHRDDYLWQCLRKPFPLCSSMQLYHQCDWEVFDIGVAGCLLCGAIHRCGKGHCPRVNTEDAEVCMITGFCVREQIFADSEYADTVASYNMGKTIHEKETTISRDIIEDMVTQLLTSPNSIKAYHMEQKRFCIKLQTHLQQLIHGQRHTRVNLVSVIEQALVLACGNKGLLSQYNLPMRQVCVHTCTTFISYIINVCIFLNLMPVRPSDVKVLVFGLVYLMRTGVLIENVEVIPRLAILQQLLPPENTLMAIHDYRPKYITVSLVNTRG